MNLNAIKRKLQNFVKPISTAISQIPAKTTKYFNSPVDYYNDSNPLLPIKDIYQRSKAAQVPQLNLGKNLTGKTKTAVEFAQAIPNLFLQAPKNTTEGLIETPLSLMKGDWKGTLRGGAKAIDLPLQTFTGGKGGALLNTGKQSLKQLAIQGAKQTSKIGGIFGAQQSLMDIKDTDTPQEIVKNVGTGTLIGMGGGALLGAGAPIASRSVKNLFSATKDISREVSAMTPEVQKQYLQAGFISLPEKAKPFQKDLDRFVSLVKQNDTYQAGVSKVGKLLSSQEVADQMGVPHEQLMDDVLRQAGKPIPQRLPPTPQNFTPLDVTPPGMKERGVMETIRTSDVTTPELRQGIEQVAGEFRYYKPYSDIDSLGNAQNLIATEGIDKAKETILKGDYNKTNVAAAEILISKAMREGRIGEATTMLKDLSVKATTSGQANQAWSMWSRLTPEGMLKYAQKEISSSAEKMGSGTKFARKILGKKAPELTKEDATIIADLMGKANTATTPEGQAKYVKMALQTISDKIPIGVSEVIDAFRYNNMLSGFPTHERNFFQNLWNTYALRPLTLAAEGRPIQALKYEAGAIKSIPKGLDAFYKTMARKIPIDMSKVEVRQVRLQKLPRPLTFFSELMEAGDKAFSAIIESAEMGRGKTLAEAQETSQNLLLRTPIGTKGKGIMSDSIDSMVQGIDAFGKKFKPVRWAVPFLRTPFNFGKMWLEYSPLGIANLKGAQDKRNVIAKAILGSTATAVGASLAMQGRTTWAVPIDQEQKEWFYATKRKPFSIKMGETWVPAQYFGPFAFAVMLPSAANYYYNEAPTALTEGDMGKLTKTMASVVSFWSQSSPMANLGGFVKTMQGDIDFNLTRNIAFTASQLKPYEGMLRYIANILDPIYRKPKTFGEQMISDIPFLTENIKETYTEPTGEPSVREPINFLLPYGIGKENKQYELFYQGRGAELQQNALENRLKKSLEEGIIPPEVLADTPDNLKADLAYSKIKAAFVKKDKEALAQLKASGLLTPEVVKQVKLYIKMEKAGIVKADRDLMQYEGNARAAEVLKRVNELAPKNQLKHLKLLVVAGIVTPDVLAEIKRLYQEQKLTSNSTN